MWLYIFSLAILGLVVAIFFGRGRSGPLGYAHRMIVGVSGSMVSNSVPVGYCLAMAFFLRLFDVEFLSSFAGYSRSHTQFIRCCYSLPFLAMARLYFSDAGVITRANHSRVEALFPYDRILFFPYKECKTCHFTKPARSKHCSVCNRCMALQDHHCLWTNNCVGLRNYRWFMLFLFVNLYVFSYGLVLLTIPLVTSFKAAWHNPERKFWLWALVGQGNAQRAGICLWLLCAAILPLVVVFILFNIRYIWAGVTTNEAEKWEDVQSLLATKSLYIYQPNTSIILQWLETGQWHRALSPEEHALVESTSAQLVPATSIADIPNIYDKGFANNLKLLLFPPAI